MRIVAHPLHIAIDGNEANVTHRVGSNVYAFEILRALEGRTRENPSIAVTVLLAGPAVNSLPPERNGWKYKIIGPKKFWTQWALPLHLFGKRKVYDIFFTPGHYAPRMTPIPYVSSVMDTAYLDYPDQFTPRDRLQLTKWTAYSVEHARKVIAISHYTRQSVIERYGKQEKDVIVAYPAINTTKDVLPADQKAAFFEKHGITQPYILFVGTLQPRKNVHRLIDAYETLRETVQNQPEEVVSKTPKSKKQKSISITPPKLVLAGKVGWLADPIINKIKKSKYAADIITTGYISDLEKKALISNALCTTLIGLHEGFGIPPLEAMQYGSIPVVANSTSLPEVVGKAGFLVDPINIEEIADTFAKILRLSVKERGVYLRAGREQATQFSWDRSADVILKTLLAIVDQTYYAK
jgi:glycosyltransferase involved in cell wall biosynthesis